MDLEEILKNSRKKKGEEEKKKYDIIGKREKKRGIS